MKIFKDFPTSPPATPLLDKIDFPSDYRDFTLPHLLELADELRAFLLYNVSKYGGHLGSSLGALELSVALHYVFDTPDDKLVFDTGHQCYIHKVLTGRKSSVGTIRKSGGLSSFADRAESIYDLASTGHAGTAISVASGLAMYETKNKVVAIIGDGGLTCGMSFEALNFFGTTGKNLLVILNDNDMSISKNVSSIGRDYEGFFRSMGANYHYLSDGNDLSHLVPKLQSLKNISGFNVLHIKTTKGAGLECAECDQEKYHALSTAKSESESYLSLFSSWLMKKATDPALIVITPAMCLGSGLKEFEKKYPEKFIDVGIAEQNAVSIASGLSISGRKVVVSIYSTFLQRAYDQLIHDICINELNVIFAIDRAGVVGEDGKSHQGAFDIAFLQCIPNLILLAPSCASDFTKLLDTAYEMAGAVAIRYPKSSISQQPYPLVEGIKAVMLRSGKKKVALLNFGALLDISHRIAQDYDFTLIDMRSIKPLDEEMLHHLSSTHQRFITIEEGSIISGAGSRVCQLMSEKYLLPTLCLGIDDTFVEQGNRAEVLEKIFDYEKIKEKINTFINV